MRQVTALAFDTVPAALEKRVLSLIGELMALLDLDEFCAGLLRELREVVPADFSALNEVPGDRADAVLLTVPEVPAVIHQAFARYGTQNPIAGHFLRTGDGRAIRISDLATRRQLHELDIYRHIYARLGVEYQIAFTLPSRSGRILGVALSRGRRDFTDRERDLLNLARPYLTQLYRNALGQPRVPAAALELERLLGLGLTARQAEVLQLIAMGLTGPEVAAQLRIAPRTVRKHLEHCYRTLGVTSRSEAARVAWNATPRGAGQTQPGTTANRPGIP